MTIETTHVGSLPRGDELSSFLLAKDKGEIYDKDQFEASVQVSWFSSTGGYLGGVKPPDRGQGPA